jgi:hypothetical protein
LPQDIKTAPTEIDWTYLFEAYAYWKENAPAEAPEFFNAFFKKLAGSNELQGALESGMRVEEWVNSYKSISFYKYKALVKDYSFYPEYHIESGVLH